MFFCPYQNYFSFCISANSFIIHYQRPMSRLSAAGGCYKSLCLKLNDVLSPFFQNNKQPATGFWQVKASLFGYFTMTTHV